MIQALSLLWPLDSVHPRRGLTGNSRSRVAHKIPKVHSIFREMRATTACRLTWNPRHRPIAAPLHPPSHRMRQRGRRLVRPDKAVGHRLLRIHPRRKEPDAAGTYAATVWRGNERAGACAKRSDGETCEPRQVSSDQAPVTASLYRFRCRLTKSARIECASIDVSVDRSVPICGGVPQDESVEIDGPR